MGSAWTHAICLGCWAKRNPARAPIAVDGADADPDPCCFCGAPTNAGVFVRADPKPLKCGGNHGTEADAPWATWRKE